MVSLTIGKPLIMGRRTWESLPGPLPGRTSIVLTRDETFACDGCLVARTVAEALNLSAAAPEVIVFGGAQIYREFLPITDRLYLTEIDAEVEGDAVFPHINPGEWREIERSRSSPDERHAFAFSFITLERVRS